MIIRDISYSFHTAKIEDCVSFYKKYFGAKVTFDAGWYVTLHFSDGMRPGVVLSFMHPDHSSIPLEEGCGQGTLNILVDDIDSIYTSMISLGAPVIRELQYRPWGDRSFEMSDPLGNVIYVWTEAEMSDEYKNAMQ